MRSLAVCRRLAPMAPLNASWAPASSTLLARRCYAVPRDETLQRVLTVVRAFDKVNESAVKPEAHFIKDLGLDSLDVVEVGLALEEEFAIEIPDADADAILSVPDAVNYLSTHPQSR